MEIFGIDVGGSGIKGAPVNIETGKLADERFRIPTPKPSKPDAVADAIHELLDHFNWKGPVGCGFPTLIINGEARSYSNIDPEWKGLHVRELFQGRTGNHFRMINDADAAGLAEMTFGAGVGKKGLVFVITVGTGLGTGVFYNGVLIPNFELGHVLYKDGRPFEKYAADSVRKNENLDYGEWGSRFDEFLQHMVRLFSPDLFILGGGASKKFEKFAYKLTVEVPVVPAKNQNNAGIIGAAMAARELL
jgi:polyphosphate glucokinase